MKKIFEVSVKLTLIALVLLFGIGGCVKLSDGNYIHTETKNYERGMEFTFDLNETEKYTSIWLYITYGRTAGIDPKMKVSLTDSQGKKVFHEYIIEDENKQISSRSTHREKVFNFKPKQDTYTLKILTTDGQLNKRDSVKLVIK